MRSRVLEQSRGQVVFSSAMGHGLQTWSQIATLSPSTLAGSPAWSISVVCLWWVMRLHRRWIDCCTSNSIIRNGMYDNYDLLLLILLCWLAFPFLFCTFVRNCVGMRGWSLVEGFDDEFLVEGFSSVGLWVKICDVGLLVEGTDVGDFDWEEDRQQECKNADGSSCDNVHVVKVPTELNTNIIYYLIAVWTCSSARTWRFGSTFCHIENIGIVAVNINLLLLNLGNHSCHLARC